MNMNNVIYSEDIGLIAKNKIFVNALRGKTVLITGASGLIGRVIVDSLMEMNRLFDTRINVIALSRNKEKLCSRFISYKRKDEFNIVEADVIKPLDLNGVKPDYLIHAASNTHPKEYSNDPVGTITTNVLGTYNLLNWLSENGGGRFVFLSSVEIYGENRGDVEKFSEDYCGFIDCNTLRAGYPESKRVSEAMVQAYIVQNHIDGVIVRLSRCYGPTIEADDSKVLSQFVNNTVKGENIVLKSEGNQLFSYVYVVDAVSAIFTAMILGKTGDAYNVADEKSDVLLKDVASYLAGIRNKKVVFQLPDEMEKRGYSVATKAVLSAEKIKKLGWTAHYGIKDGLFRTVKAILLSQGERL